jgi:hypothetical protein
MIPEDDCQGIDKALRVGANAANSNPPASGWPAVPVAMMICRNHG